MKMPFQFGVAVLLGIVLPQLAGAVAPTADEMAEARRWVAAKFEGVSDGKSEPDRQAFGVEPFLSFVYDGKPSAELLKTWELNRESRSLDAQRMEHTLTYTDRKTGIVLRCIGIEYRDFPAVEWTLYLKNARDKDTPILEGLQALDAFWPTSPACSLVVHHAKGSDANFGDFAPLSSAIGSGERLAIGSHGRGGNRGGSPSVESMPFFNVASGDEGVIFGLGWTGPWAAEVVRASDGAVRVRAGMERMHLLLHPGEEIRSPRVVALFWRGDRLRAQNLWRRFLLAYHSPRPGGKPFAGMIADANWGSWMPADTHTAEINYWGDHNLPMECYWIDAGWTDMSLGWEAHQSHQVPNAALFPNGMRPLADAAHRRGMKFLLWMVPPSVHPAVGIGKEHPEWLGESFTAKEYGSMVFHGLDHGDPRVNQYMIDHFSKIVGDFGVDVFRQDGGNLWPEDKDANRFGMSQIQYIQGFHAFWDGLLKNHPGLLIDNCAEGGRKIDIETIGRSIVLWRSDSQASGDFDSISNQGFNHGLLSWVPLCGAAVPMKHLSPYSFRSAYCPALLIGWPMGNVASLQDRWSGVDVDLLRKLLKEYVAVRPYVFGDYYPLAPYSLDQNAWIAWQFDRPDLGEGMVQAFRRNDCGNESMPYKLYGLEPNAVYALTNLDVAGTVEMTGCELMESGLSIAIKDQPGAVIITYQKKSN